MKNVFCKGLSLGLLLGLATSMATAARSGRELRPTFGDHPAARRDVRAYVEANVLPVLRQQRQKLETQLVPADQLALANYRTQLRALKAEGKDLRQEISPKGTTKTERPTLTDEQKTQAQTLRTQTRILMTGVEQIAQKYSANLQQLAAEVEPQKARWTADITAIVQKDATPEQKEKLARWQGFAAHHGALGKLLKPAMFLLLEPATPATIATTSTSLYPNPATAATQLQYEVKKAGFVRVDLLDASGSQLRTLAPGLQQEAGPQTLPLDLSNLPKGTYYYKITTPSGTETKRFEKE